MKYLKLFENFNDNKPVVSALKDILSCINSGKKSLLNLMVGQLWIYTIIVMMNKLWDF